MTGAMKNPLTTRIALAVPPGRVWSVLTDFSGYADWNPFLTKVEGVAAAGERLRVELLPPGESVATATTPVVTACEPDRRLAWRGAMGPPGMFTFDHEMALEPTETGCRFGQTVRFSGLLVTSFAGMVDRIEAGLTAMDKALQRKLAG